MIRILAARLLTGACLLGLGSRPAISQTAADSLPAFQSDSLRDEPFRRLESAPAVWSAVKDSGSDSAGGAARDSARRVLPARRPYLGIQGGVSFMDFSAKEVFNRFVDSLRAADSTRSRVLQPFEPVHLAFPISLVAGFPINRHFDAVAKTHSYWYKQTAILGDSMRAQGEEWYAVQANLGGVGLRYYFPPDLLSVSGQLAFYVQGVCFWNLGGTEIYSPHGHAGARFSPTGSAYELQMGFRQALTKAWAFNGSLGFLKQDYASRTAWSRLLPRAAPEGEVAWGSTALEASLNLLYFFGFTPEAGPAPPGAAAPAAPAIPATEAPVSK